MGSRKKTTKAICGVLTGCVCLLLLISVNGFGQKGQIMIEVKKCAYDSKNLGKKLIVHLQTDTGELISDVGYRLSTFIDMPDSAKLKIIESLLFFKNDTSLCCLKVISRSFNGIEGCGGKPDGIDEYDIQIDALYMINRLCWPGFIEAYSCVPVLFDKKMQKPINDNHQKVAIVFESYIKWYNECRIKGSISRYFPFNAGRYVWYNGHDIHISDAN